VQAITRHDIGLAAEDSGGVFLHIHQFKDAELASLIVEKQVNVGIVTSLAARRRAEHIKLFDAEPFQIGFVPPQSAYGFIAFHGSIIANSAGFSTPFVSPDPSQVE
jgi:cold shock CspA family protein